MNYELYLSFRLPQHCQQNVHLSGGTSILLTYINYH